MGMSVEGAWKLKSINGFKSGRSEAMLCSKLLDRVLYPEGCVQVSVAGAGSKKPPGYLLDEFTRESIQQFVFSQESLRKALAGGLIADRKDWGVKPPVREDQLWGEVQVTIIAFDKKNVPTPQGLANMKRLMPKIDIKRLKDAADKPQTKTRFTIMISVAWDDEHARLATFRDGKLASMELY